MIAIETNKLTKKFKDKIAVNELDLSIKQGELFALLGVNGAGKTTTIKMLSGLILPTKGSIKIENMDMKKDVFKIKEELNVSPQETAIAPNLTVKENLEFMAGVYLIKDKDKKINELIIFHSSFLAITSNPNVGSSKNNIFGSLIKLIAIDTFLCQPPDKVFALLFITSSSLNCLTSSFIFFSLSFI